MNREGYSQLKNGLISSFYFSGNARDTVGNSHGLVRGATLAADRFGKANSAYCFNGRNQYISLGTNRDLKQSSMSISLWAKVTDYNCDRKNLPTMCFVATRARDEIEYYEAYAMGMIISNHKFAASGVSALQHQIGILSQQTAEIDRWNHIVYMFDPDTCYLYVNGRLEQKNYRGFITSYLLSDSVLLGYLSNYKYQKPYYNYIWFNGCLDDIKFYNRVLKADEVVLLYKEEPGGIVETSAQQGFLDGLREYWYVPLVILLSLLVTILVIRWRALLFRKRSLLQQQLLQAEMRALRSQMNPHFIFNAINSIQHYVLTNEKDLANKYLVKFSKLMRNILDLSKEELITLGDELETVTLYLEIESLRFNNAFSFTITVDNKTNPKTVMLPPLLIQPFVENAIWHGLLPKEGAKDLDIKVHNEGKFLIIEIDDNGIGRKASALFRNDNLQRRSLGMDLTQSRLNVIRKAHGIDISFTVKDKTGDGETALGTTVIIKLELEKKNI